MRTIEGGRENLLKKINIDDYLNFLQYINGIN